MSFIFIDSHGAEYSIHKPYTLPTLAAKDLLAVEFEGNTYYFHRTGRKMCRKGIRNFIADQNNRIILDDSAKNLIRLVSKNNSQNPLSSHPQNELLPSLEDQASSESPFHHNILLNSRQHRQLYDRESSPDEDYS